MQLQQFPTTDPSIRPFVPNLTDDEAGVRVELVKAHAGSISEIAKYQRGVCNSMGMRFFRHTCAMPNFWPLECGALLIRRDTKIGFGAGAGVENIGRRRRSRGFGEASHNGRGRQSV